MGYLFRLGLWLARWPGPRLARRISSLAAWILDTTNSQTAQVTRVNIEYCLTHLSASERTTLVRDSLRNLVLLIFEFAQLAYMPERKLLDQIRSVQGKELLDEAYQSGRGVLLLVPHYGNWELLCAFLGAHYNFAALYDPPKIASLEQVILDARQRFRGEMFPIDTGGMRSLFKVLRQGKLIVILPDQVPDRKGGVYADFFGHPALTMTLVNRIVNKNAPVVLLGSVARLAPNIDLENELSYQLCFEGLAEPLAGPDTEACAKIMNEAIENVVLRNPAQYQWQYKRFKRPPGNAGENIYRRQ